MILYPWELIQPRLASLRPYKDTIARPGSCSRQDYYVVPGEGLPEPKRHRCWRR
jgi:hypothetical protein